MLLFFVVIGCDNNVQEKPNILLILVDDLNDWTGFLNGHPQAKTPNMDRLAKKGMVFTNAHTNAPLCGPSRSSMLSGLRPSTTGIYFHISDNDLIAQVKDSTLQSTLLPNYFKSLGYATLGVGKIFHNGDAAGVFDEYGGLSNFGPRPKERFKYDPVWFEKPKGTSTDWGTFPKEDTLTFDHRIADWAIQQLEESHDRPFFLAAGFMRPHVPWYVPQKWFNSFPLDSIQLPAYSPNDWTDISEMAQLITDWPMMPEMDWMMEEGRWKEAVQAYLASVFFVDYQIGRVLDALEASEFHENTIVILASDHGYHLGEKGLFQKGTLWKRSTRIPLVFAGPGIVDSMSDEPVSLLDIYPSIIDLLNNEVPLHLEGKSLMPILEGRKKTISNYAISTFGMGNHSIYNREWHYIHYHNGSEELYHMVDDPHEWNNIANNELYRETIQLLRDQLPKQNEPNNASSHFYAVPYYMDKQ